MSKKSLLMARKLSDGRTQGSGHVPKGSIPTSYLTMPEFRDLMDLVAEEFGFQNTGELQIPCDEQPFENILHRCATQLN
ncbi:hypothetical protein Goklo_010674, partial [Gossypium klotzschianum]|nr:hypothetical protein [Gossypium klotzschianum]